MSANPTEWSVGRLIEWTRNYFSEKGLHQPRLATELLLSYALGCRKIELYTRYDLVPSTQQLQQFRELVQQAADHTPIAYLVGKKEFYSLNFSVTPAVLIPRPETEVLVEQVIRHIQSQPPHQIDVLDFGTGSGCVGLTLCKYLPNVHVQGSDISPEALEIARQNAALLQLADRFRLSLADGLEPIQGPLDILVSNPPYVAVAERDSLDPAVSRFEPALALLAGEDGLCFYRHIAQHIHRLLRRPGEIFLEIGYNQHDAVADIMTAAPHVRHVQSWQDHNEGHWRVMQFQHIQ